MASPTRRFSYLGHHCGLRAGELRNKSRLSKYSRWAEELADQNLLNRSPIAGRRETVLEKAQLRVSHPNFTKYWGYLNPRLAPILSGRSGYQLYATRPSFEQFRNLFLYVASSNSALLKYARLECLEHRHDTVVVYSADATDIRRLFVRLEHNQAFDETAPLPGFATLSLGNLSLSGLRDVSPLESNGQTWQRLLEDATGNDQHIHDLHRSAYAEFVELANMLQAGGHA